jgi:hypothetical protein
VIDIDTQQARVFLQMRWQYTWLVRPPLAPWTRREQQQFHGQVDRAIWATWSNRVSLNASGTAAFARRVQGQGVSINLDVRWVLADPHWQVTVTKIPAGDFATSSVVWNSRTISLDSNDAAPVTRCSAGPVPICNRQIPVTHEFGHAAGNTIVLGRGDEYVAGSAHLADRSSLMNVGNELRDRHFRTILEELNQMIPNCTFTVARIR